MYDWTPGRHYYFSEDEEERFIRPCLKFTSGPNTVLRRKTEKGKGDASDQAGEDVSQSTLVSLRGTVRNFLIDTAVPPLRKEEVERWRFEGYAIMKGLSVRRRTDQLPPRMLLPIDAKVTYLGDDVRKVDQMLRQSGYYTISEVAEALMPYVPTFPVEVRHLIQALPDSLVRKIDQDWGRSDFALAVILRYPMLFIYHFKRYSKSLVQLNPTYWFVRQHPSYGKADHFMRKYRVYEQVGLAQANEAGQLANAQASPQGGEDDRAITGATGAGVQGATTSTDGEATASAVSAGGTRPEDHVPLSVRLFQMLVRNLARFPTPPSDAAAAAAATFHATKTLPYVKERYAPFNLVQWINSFPSSDAELISSVPEQTVLHVLCQYVNVFQLMSLTESDQNMFVQGNVLLEGRARRKAARHSQGGASKKGSGDSSDSNHCRDDENTDDDDVTSAEGWDGSDQLDQLSADAETESAAAAAARTARFHRAVEDDLIDVESILTGPEQGSAAASLPRDGDNRSHGAVDNSSAAFASGEVKEGHDDDKASFLWDKEVDDHDHDNDDADGGNGHLDTDRWDSNDLSASPRGLRAGLPQGASVDGVTFFGLPLEDIYVRRLPPDIAARSLSDWDETTSPDVHLVALAARFLAPPPSVQCGGSSNNFFTQSARQYNSLAPLPTVWRWVPVERLYHGYTVEQRHYLRREYKGLVNFLRYHGKLFELSNDLLYVIAHDPEGQLAPIPFNERRFDSAERVVLPRTFDDNPAQSAALVGESERTLFSRITSEGRVPTCRRHLLLLDPNNPVLLPDVFHEDIASLLPNYPVRLTHVIPRLPPVLRAAMPYRANFRASKVLETYSERGVTMLRKRVHGAKTSFLASATVPMSVEDAIAEVLQLPIGPEGVTVRALRFMHLSAAAVDTLCDHYGTLSRALDAYPQYFRIERQVIGKKTTVVVKFRK